MRPEGGVPLRVWLSDRLNMDCSKGSKRQASQEGQGSTEAHKCPHVLDVRCRPIGSDHEPQEEPSGRAGIRLSTSRALAAAKDPKTRTASAVPQKQYCSQPSGTALAVPAPTAVVNASANAMRRLFMFNVKVSGRRRRSAPMTGCAEPYRRHSGGSGR